MNKKVFILILLIEIAAIFGYTYSCYAANVHIVKDGVQKSYIVQFEDNELQSLATYIYINDIQRLGRNRYLIEKDNCKVYFVFDKIELNALNTYLSELQNE